MKKANFWDNLPKPFSVLAPMEDVTDMVFRQTMLVAGRPDVFFTEFTSVDGVYHFLTKSEYRNPNIETSTKDQINSNDQFSKLRENPVMRRLVFSDVERPVVAQIWGKDPEKFFQAAEKIVELGFDGIDINMGCPDRAVLKQGCGAALAGENALVAEIVEAVKKGGRGLPVSVKTRLGNKKKEEGWIEFLLEQDLAALTVHARIAKDMSLVPARWEEIKMIVNFKNQIPNCKTKIIGNGDIKSLEDPRIEESGVDGVMIGRGVFDNPWVFNKSQIPSTKSQTERIQLLKIHLGLWEKVWRASKIPNSKFQAPNGEVKHNQNLKKHNYIKDYSIMKKFFKMYVRDFDGAAELRAKLMETKEVSEAMALLD